MRHNAIVATAALSLGLVVGAEAAVFCQKKSGAVFIRSECKKKETQVDLASFGAIGPKGDKGDAGDPGMTGPPGTARAYAHIVPGPSPTIDMARSKNVVSVSRFFEVYCVVFDPSIDLNASAALVSAAFNDRSIYASPASCTIGGKTGVQVETFDSSGTSVEDTGFFVLIP